MTRKMCGVSVVASCIALIPSILAQSLPAFEPGGTSVDFSKTAAETAGAAGDAGVTIRLIPFSYLDNVYCLGEGEPGLLMLACRNEKSEKVENPFVYLELPDTVRVIDVRQPLRIVDERKGMAVDVKTTVYKIDVNEIKDSFLRDVYGSKNSVVVMLDSTLPVGRGCSGRYWYQDGAYKTESKQFRIRIIPGLKGKTPKLFETGAVFDPEQYFESKAACDSLASYYAKLGFNVVHGIFPPFLAAMGNHGIKRYVQPFWLCNGYRLGVGEKPENVKFKMADGKTYTSGGAENICPVEVYTRGDYFKEQIVKPLRTLLVEEKTADAIMSNWEPYASDWKGCFCSRCMNEFIAFSGIPRTEVQSLWPGQILRTYRQKWIAFRSWQHGKLMATLEETVSQIGKAAEREMHFVPEVGAGYYSESGNAEAVLYNPYDFVETVPVVVAWGPYLFRNLTSPYAYTTGEHLITYAAAEELQRLVAAKTRDRSKRPMFIAFPHGWQLNVMATEPEAIMFESLCFFVQGWKGAMAYHFPVGYDARYWNALGKANTLIAENENFVLKGKPANNVSFKVVSPVPAIPAEKLKNIDKYWRDCIEKMPSQSVIQCKGYEYDGTQMVAIGNFWEKADAFVRLSIRGLSNHQKYVLRQRDLDCHFTGKTGDAALTSRELADGVTVHVGALRFVFLTVEPYRAGVQYGTPVTPALMNGFMKQRLVPIEKAMAFEREWQATEMKKVAAETRLPDYARQVKPVRRGAMSCALETGTGSKAGGIVVKNGADRLVLDPAVGGRLRSWKRGTIELIATDPKRGAFVDAFWWPSKAATAVESPYQVQAQELTDEGLRLVLGRTLSARDNPYLEGVELTKEFRFREKGGGVSAITAIKNTTRRNLEFAFRYHNLLGALDVQNGISGRAELKRNGETVVLERLYQVRLFRVASAPDKELEKAFALDNIQTVTEGTVVFAAPWMPFKVTATLMNETDLYGFIFWDSGRQPASTFEPVFKRVKLAPGQSWRCGMSLGG